MTTTRLTLGPITLSVNAQGPQTGPAVVFTHPLGTSKEIWDGLFARLPTGLRLVRFDTRGHGASDAPQAPYTMGQLVTDAERLLDHLTIRDCVFVGAGFGGLVAQGLAVKRLDQIRALVLCNTAAKLGTIPLWERRIAQARDIGLPALAQAMQDKWFTRQGRNSAAARYWVDAVARTSTQGYIGCCSAIAGTDFYTPTSGLRLPCLGIAGTEDGVTPPDLMRETIELIPGAQFKLLRRSGHLPSVDATDQMAAVLTGFLEDIGHVG